jgi:subtilisin family serine protease
MKALLLAIASLLVAASAAAAEPAGPPLATADDARPRVLVLLNLPAAHFRADGNYASGYADASGRAARRRVASALAEKHGLALLNEWPMPVVGLDCYVMAVPDARGAEAVAGALSEDSRVEWAQAMNTFRPLGHDDPLFTLQPAASAWRLDELHRAATGREVRIAVIDSGVQLDHPDLAGQIAASANLVGDRPFVGELHGTAVAGVIAARADNRVGIAGVAPGARLLALRSCVEQSTQATSCTTLGLALALSAAIERDAQVINLSLGGPPDRLVRRLVDAALARRIAVVAAVDRNAERGGFPASLDGVVAASDEPVASARAGTLVAPGRDVPTTVPPSRWATVSGASYAAAHVSGLLALLLEMQRGAAGRGAAAAAALVVAGADGRVDACASLARVRAACVCQCAAAPATEAVARH